MRYAACSRCVSWAAPGTRTSRAGWRRCGAGDWAIALRSPDDTTVARISLFDPTGPYTAALYREAARTRQVPILYAHRRLAGGGDLQLLEWLRLVPEDRAAAFHRATSAPTADVTDLVDVVRRIHQRARRELPWCGPLDTNPSNIMGASDGRLVLVDPLYADGPNLYATAAADPGRVVALIPEPERRPTDDNADDHAEPEPGSPPASRHDPEPRRPLLGDQAARTTPGARTVEHLVLQ
ncbi:hypothetical protein ACFFWC_25025 [Plantactinospora siamensis]|uniref:Aminoglycoside phosphotransferase domain-containing protein n=1 Tax=Plantactinospora siamensis TaxID=555372 RepID=A0ABV6NWG0_9ACTN